MCVVVVVQVMMVLLVRVGGRVRVGVGARVRVGGLGFALSGGAWRMTRATAPARATKSSHSEACTR